MMIFSIANFTPFGEPGIVDVAVFTEFGHDGVGGGARGRAAVQPGTELLFRMGAMAQRLEGVVEKLGLVQAGGRRTLGG